MSEVPQPPEHADGGELKVATVLFADIVESTEAISGLDADDADLLLNSPIRLMQDAVRRFGGNIVKYQGDGIMALFGAPLGAEDHARRACLAALDLRQASRSEAGPEYRLRIGIGSGEILAKPLEGGLANAYDAVGAVVHLAARLENMARPDEILLSEETWRLAQLGLHAEDLGLRMVRGFAGPVRLYRLQDQALDDAPPPASGTMALFGREREQARLSPLIAPEPPPVSAILLRGEIGIGKTALSQDLAVRGEACGARMLYIRSTPYAATLPLQLARELLRSLFGLASDDDAPAVAATVRAQLHELGFDDTRLEAVFLSHLGCDDIAPESAGTRDAERLYAAISRVLCTLSQRQTCVLMVEDLHWLAAPALALIDHLLAVGPPCGLRMLMTARPEFTHVWPSIRQPDVLQLAPLAVADAARLVKDRLAARLTAEHAERIRQQGDGNPLFIEELCRTAEETGAGAMPNSSPLPLSVRSAVSARIDRLEPQSKRFLQVAAVAGEGMPLALVHRLLEADQPETAEVPPQLMSRQFLATAARREGRLIRFHHPLIRQVAHDSLRRGRRRELHTAIAACLEDMAWSTAGERAGLVAYHLAEAGELQKAAARSAEAALWYGPRQSGAAMAFWRRAQALIEEAGRVSEDKWLYMMASGQLVNLGWREGMSASDVQSNFDRASAIASGLKDTSSSVLIGAAYGRALAGLGRPGAYLEEVDRMVSLLRGPEDDGLRKVLTLLRAHALSLQGRTQESLSELMAALDQSAVIGAHEARMLGFDIDTWGRYLRAHMQGQAGNFQEAQAALQDLSQSLHNSDDLFHRALCAFGLIRLEWMRLETGQADSLADSVERLAAEQASAYLGICAAAARGKAHLMNGRHDAAEEVLSRGVADAQNKIAGREFLPTMQSDLAVCQAELGRFGDAEALANAVITDGERCRAENSRCLGLLARARTYTLRGGPGDRHRARDDCRTLDAAITTVGTFGLLPRLETLRAMAG